MAESPKTEDETLDEAFAVLMNDEPEPEEIDDRENRPRLRYRRPTNEEPSNG
jgi:hypothetical protein